MGEKQFFVYIMANRIGGTVYVGVTSRLVQRAYEHRNDLVEGFTKRHGLHKLVWYELHTTAENAILREKRVKQWKRIWRIDLIEQQNPNWIDLYPLIAGTE